MLIGHLLPQKGNYEITLNYFLLYVVLWVPYTFWNLECSPEETRLLEPIAITGRIILKCILKKCFWNMWTAFLGL